MPRASRVILLLILFFSAVRVVESGGRRDQPRTPLMRRVEPAEGRPGDVLTVFGDALDKTRVREVYLTNGKEDYKAEILEQSENSVRFRLPSRIPPGRVRLMVLLADEATLIEQPVYVEVLDERLPTPGKQ